MFSVQFLSPHTLIGVQTHRNSYTPHLHVRCTLYNECVPDDDYDDILYDDYLTVSSYAYQGFFDDYYYYQIILLVVCPC